MLKILGRNTSSNVMKVLWVCDELGIEYDREDVGGAFGKNDQPDYLAMNPNGLVPTIIDDGFVLWESNAIVRYLANKHGDGSDIWPNDPQIRASADRWMEWLSTTVAAPMVLVFRNLVRETDETRNMDEVALGTKQATRLWGMLDQHLAENDFVTGATFTIGDIPLGVHARRWIELRPEPAGEMKNLLAWFERLKQRPAYHHCLIPLQ
ncbi:MAG: glutathione S-transferase [Rhodospirillaceae bacterium]|nr:glutathione S-transferase [Rhodospirillaceae bacterium]HAA91512.1 glutathione S-transferase [Rhodospirillaceae bacterium]